MTRRAICILLAGLTLYAGPASASGEATVELTIRHSRFVPSEIIVPRGTTVRFVVRNLDPIAHELIVGDEAVQLRHELGTEPHHGTVPGEVSVGVLGVAETTYTFTEREQLLYGCHLPGHWAYGMRGVVRVT